MLLYIGWLGEASPKSHTSTKIKWWGGSHAMPQGKKHRSKGIGAKMRMSLECWRAQKSRWSSGVQGIRETVLADELKEVDGATVKSWELTLIAMGSDTQELKPGGCVTWYALKRDDVSVVQDEGRSGDGRWWWLHNSVNVLNATEQNIFKWLRWKVLCYVYFTMIFVNFFIAFCVERERHWCERETSIERNINWLPPICILTRDWTCKV